MCVVSVNGRRVKRQAASDFGRAVFLRPTWTGGWARGWGGRDVSLLAIAQEMLPGFVVSVE